MNDRPTLELPADRVQADDGAFLITMPGEPLPQPYHTIESGFVPAGTPSELVALNQPCPTCGGLGRANAAICSDSCPDCGGSGRLVFDLKVPCQACDDGLRYAESPAAEADMMTVICGYCNGVGTVSHRVWLDPEWGILPIRGTGDVIDEWDSGGWTACVAVAPVAHNGEVVRVTGHRQWEKIENWPPAARPGDYVARAHAR